MDHAHDPSRRELFRVSAVTGAGILIGRYALAAEEEKKDQKKEKDVSPAEDLMREHGLLKRVMLCYDEIARRVEAKQEASPDALRQCAQIIRDFVEDYHEKLEEQYLFPRFRQANKLVDLVETLDRQHQAGRKVTDIILQNAALKSDDERQQVVRMIREFNRMYAPHEAREDTVLFPAFHEIVSGHEYDALGEDFEKKENEKFGEDGFEHMVDKVAGIEKELGIYDLAQFTPKV
ncbi:MAG TPA: hemerythrin domain-containing protein [Tepidisphaeraceae bacterium]|jgi:hemerythrin-like domain-containing protein